MWGGEKHLHPNNGIATSSESKETSGCSSGGAKSLDVDTGLSGRVTFGKCMHFAQTKNHFLALPLIKVAFITK